MRYLRPYSIYESNIYDVDWRTILPKRLKVSKDGVHYYILGNIMKDANMVQVCYENETDEWGVPSTLEFDFYFSENPKSRIDIDITWGDEMVFEFYLELPNKVGVIETDDFKLDDKSFKLFVNFLNRFKGFNIDTDQLSFLR